MAQTIITVFFWVLPLHLCRRSLNLLRRRCSGKSFGKYHPDCCASSKLIDAVQKRKRDTKEENRRGFEVTPLGSLCPQFQDSYGRSGHIES